MGAHFGMPAMALLDTDGVYGAPRFHLAAKKIGLKAHIGAEVTCNPLQPVIAPHSVISSHPVILSGARASQSEALAESKDPYHQESVPGIGIPRFARNDSKKRNDKHFRLPLLVSSRSGYQNLCRLITRMKLRAKKGEGAVYADELQEHAHGLICLTGGAEGPLAAALQQGGMDEARRCVDQLVGIFGAGKCLRRITATFSARRRSPQSRRDRHCSFAESSAAGHQRCLLRHSTRSPTLRRLHRHSQPSHAIDRRTPAYAQRRTLSEISAGDAATFRRLS